MAKGKKGKKKQAVVIEERFNQMTTKELESFLADNESKLATIQKDRNYVQLERDTIHHFYDITNEELSSLKVQCSQLDRELEEIERNHRIDIKVYLQKIKHLNFEHKSNENNLINEELIQIDDENNLFGERVETLKIKKANLKLLIAERGVAYEEEINEIKKNNNKNYNRIIEEFEANQSDRNAEFEEKLSNLKLDLELKRKVEVHELEERINQHINDLMTNHENNFSQIKNYYNDITKDNLKLINSLKDGVNQLETKAANNQKLMNEIAQENKRLFGPLNAALEELNNLKIALKDYNKNKTRRINTINRLNEVNERLKILQVELKALQEQFETVSQERDLLYEKFDNTVSSIERRSDMKNIVLDRKIQAINQDYAQKDAQFKAALSAANLDPNMEYELATQLTDIIQQRDQIINDLEYAIIRVTKSHNDIIRTYQSKFDKIVSVNEIPTEASRGPAGLVAQGFE